MPPNEWVAGCQLPPFGVLQSRDRAPEANRTEPQPQAPLSSSPLRLCFTDPFMGKTRARSQSSNHRTLVTQGYAMLSRLYRHAKNVPQPHPASDHRSEPTQQGGL